MEKTVASRLGAVAVGLGMAMASGSGIAYATTDSNQPSPKSASSQRSEAKSDKSREARPRADSASEPKRAPSERNRESSSERDDNDGGEDDRRSKSAGDRTRSTDRPAPRDTDVDDAAPTDETLENAPEVSDLAESTDTPNDPPPVAAPDEPEPDTELRGLRTEADPEPAPPTPAGALAWLTSVASWVQREVDYFVRGGVTPETDPRRVVFDASSNTLYGTLHVVGDERDWFTYELVDGPKFGTVQFSPDGGYVYTVNEPQAEGTTDSFTVAVRNHGFNLPTLLGLFNRSVNTSTVEVGVDTPASGGLTDGRSFNDFDIYNFTQHTIRLAQKSTMHTSPSGPPVGALLAPGEFHRFHVVSEEYRTDAYVTVQYTAVDGATTTYTIRMMANASALIPDKSIHCDSSCLPSNSIYGTSGMTAVLVDTAGTQVDVYDDQAQRQAQVLNQLCQTASLSTCSFKATSQEFVAGDREVAASFANWSDHPFVYSKSISKVVSEKVSIAVGLKLGTKIADLVSVELQRQYGQEWTTTRTVTNAVDLSVAPMTVETIYVRQPMIRYTGDFTVTAGNTTWVLHNVHFDIPDTSSTGFPVWTRTTEPLDPTGAEGTPLEILL